MADRVVVIGAGIIGASVAYRLARRGAEVIVLEAGTPGAMASGASYGWINASFHLNAAHFRLRVEAIAAWHRLLGEVPDLPVAWPGCLYWEEAPAELEARASRLSALGYPVEVWDRARVAAAMPAVAAPEMALFLPSEGAADAGPVARRLLAAAGVRAVTGCRVEAVETAGGRVTGVRIPGGTVPAERVVIAAGVATDTLTAPLGIGIPLLYRPSSMMRTRPVAPCLPHLAVVPGLELRQAPSGEILAPASPDHQADAASALEETPVVLADKALDRLREVLPGVKLDWGSAVFAARPMPGDGLPVVGAAGPEGLSVAVLHSGVTLGPLIGELVAEEVLGGASDWLAPYRPARFA